MDAKLTLADAQIQLAVADLRAARLVAAGGLYRNAISNLYYAAYHCAAALLSVHGIEAASHDGVQSMFSMHFVKAGALPASAAKFLGNLYHARLTADYKGLIELTADDYRDSLAQCVSVVVGCADYLERNFPDLDSSAIRSEIATTRSA
jgi:uncharacterized protein (UPF0332 family)